MRPARRIAPVGAAGGIVRSGLPRLDTARLRRVNPKSVEAQMKTRSGDRYDRETLARDLEALYVTDDFEQVHYRFEEHDGKCVLVVEPVEKSGGPTYLRFGLSLGTDFKGESAFTLTLDHRAAWLNSRGPEWRNDVYLGQRTGWESELYQPIDLARNWFVAPSIRIDQQAYNLFVDDHAGSLPGAGCARQPPARTPPGELR
jgi:NTE family protein